MVVLVEEVEVHVNDDTEDEDEELDELLEDGVEDVVVVVVGMVLELVVELSVVETEEVVVGVVAADVVDGVELVVVDGVDVVVEELLERATYAATPATATTMITIRAKKTAAMPLEDVRNWMPPPFGLGI